jgi:GNAT superfamily N-acetyltransferase
MNALVSLRPATPDDAGFLLRVYAGTRQEEMSAWGWNAAQQAAFVQMQYRARERSYAMAYASAETSVISLEKELVGSMIVSRAPDCIRLADIALLLEYRRQGIGSHLIRQLMAESAGSRIPLRLSVLVGSPAARLYQQLGFALCQQDAMYCEMEYSSSRPATAAQPSRETDSHAGERQ